MAVSLDGVKFIHKKRKGTLGLVFLSILEFFFTIVLVISLSANVWVIKRSEAIEGVSRLLSYQGRLTDTSGNVLGGSGTNYCFRFSVYDADSGGGKLWPSSTPTATVASVSSGVFNSAVGLVPAYGEEGGGDTLASFSFYSNETMYLNVEVGGTWSSASACTTASWESLTPRQRIDAVGYARVAEDVYSDLLYTDTTNGYVRIGSGVGRASGQKLLVLDVKNAADTIGGACTVNGSVWYNSSNTRALVCDNSTIQEMGNLATIVGIKEQSAGSAITSGTVNFSAQANITISQDAQTLKFSVAAPGGGGYTQSYWPTYPIALGSATNNTGTTAAGTNISDVFHLGPLFLQDAVSFSRINLLVSNITVAGTGSGSIARNVGIYTLNGGTAFSLLSSFLFRHEVSQNSVTAQSHRFYWGTNSTSNSSSSGGNISVNYAGVRALPIFTGNTSLSAGKYYVVYGQYNITAGVNAFSAYNNMYISESATTAGQLGSAASQPLVSKWLGVFSSTTQTNVLTAQFMPVSINTSAITNTGGTSQQFWPYINFVGS